MSKTLMVIEVGEEGVNRVLSQPRTVAEAAAVARIQSATALAVRLLHDAILESKVAPANPPVACAEPNKHFLPAFAANLGGRT